VKDVEKHETHSNT